MRVNLELSYVNQIVVFKNLEFDDEMLVSEDYLPRQAQCIDENNERIWEDFLGDLRYEIKRHAST
jgi:hypothetical protein